MFKKLSVLALAGLIALPTLASAASNAELEERIAELEEQREGWDLASRIQLNGDFRSRYDWMEQERIQLLNPANPLGGIEEVDDKNSGIFTNRFRLNLRAKATENIEVKVRLAMYKAWGMQDTPNYPTGTWGGFPAFDGTVSRQVSDSGLDVDRAFMNWNNIAGQPIWFSIGRRPTTDGAPSHIRMNSDKRMATPTAYMDWPFDGISVGYAYGNLFGIEDAPGRVRVCYGRGFENGVNQDDTNYISDTDFIGVSWDVYSKGHRLAYLQSFAAMDVFNYPDFTDEAVDAMFAMGMGPRDNIGNIYHTSAVYMDKVASLNYFASVGWSQTDPSDEGMFNDPFSIDAGERNNQDNENGYNIHVGARYDLDDLGLKLGAEYNHGSEHWIGMTPGHDDMYSGKLAARGDVFEIYMIYDLPSGEATSKFASAFLRLGYQHYELDYAGGMDWNFKPYDLDNDQEAAYAAFLGLDTVTSRDQVYLTLEATF